MPAYALTWFIFLLAACVQGYTGFGSALLAIPLLTFYLPMKTVVPLVVLSGLVITAGLATRLWSKSALKRLPPLLLGALPGIGLGAWLLTALPAAVLRAAVGIALLAYAAFGLLARVRPRRLHAAWAAFAGFTSGLLSAALGAGGPPVIVYTSLIDWKPDQIKAVLSLFFLTTSTLIVVVQGASGLAGMQVYKHFAAALPGLLMGLYLGLRLSARVSPASYRRVVLVMLGLLGVGMLVF
jgi:uncharacterized protein